MACLHPISWTNGWIFSSPEQHSRRAIVLPLALASASTNVKVFIKVFRPHYFLTLSLICFIFRMMIHIDPKFCAVPSPPLLVMSRSRLAGLGGSVGCAVWLETRRSRVQPPPRSATFFHGDWSWNIFYGHSFPSADSRRAVVSFWRMNVHNTG